MEYPKGLMVLLLADTAEQISALRQLTPQDQLRIIVGLFVIVILGVVIFMIIKAGAHMARGFAAAANRLPKTSLPKEDDWATPMTDTPDVEA